VRSNITVEPLVDFIETLFRGPGGNTRINDSQDNQQQGENTRYFPNKRLPLIVFNGMLFCL
jgi:hypothetical protein